MPEKVPVAGGGLAIEVSMANAALLRNLIVYLVFKGVVPEEHLDFLFAEAKADFARYYDARYAEGAGRFLDHQRASIATASDRQPPRRN